MLNQVQDRMNSGKADEKSLPLHAIFTKVTKYYDFLNRLLTWGWDESWRKKAATICMQSQPQKILDLCCGTGDLVLRLAKLSQADVQLTALDYSVPMLELAQKKAAQSSRTKINFVHGKAEAMPFSDASFDVIGIAFALRNITWNHPKRAQILAEIYRVLKPKARLVVVETCQPQNRLLRFFYHLYFKIVVQSVGRLFSRHPNAYTYLAHSATQFYDSAQLSKLMVSAGFCLKQAVPLLGGIAAIHVFEK